MSREIVFLEYFEVKDENQSRQTWSKMIYQRRIVLDVSHSTNDHGLTETFP